MACCIWSPSVQFSPDQRIKASLDANNRGSYQLMTALNLQKGPELIHVCRITKESERS